MKVSILTLLGLPSEFGVFLLSFTFILILVPYLSGSDFGILKVPNFSISSKEKIKFISPFLFIIIVLFHYPIISTSKDKNIDYKNNEFKNSAKTISNINFIEEIKNKYPDKRLVKLDVNGYPLKEQNLSYENIPWFCVLDLKLEEIWEVSSENSMKLTLHSILERARRYSEKKRCGFVGWSLPLETEDLDDRYLNVLNVDYFPYIPTNLKRKNYIIVKGSAYLNYHTALENNRTNNKNTDHKSYSILSINLKTTEEYKCSGNCFNGVGKKIVYMKESTSNRVKVIYNGEWKYGLPHSKGELSLFNFRNDGVEKYKETEMIQSSFGVSKEEVGIGGKILSTSLLVIIYRSFFGEDVLSSWSVAHLKFIGEEGWFEFILMLTLSIVTLVLIDLGTLSIFSGFFGHSTLMLSVILILMIYDIANIITWLVIIAIRII